MIDFAKRFASDNDDTVYSGEIIEEEDSQGNIITIDPEDIEIEEKEQARKRTLLR